MRSPSTRVGIWLPGLGCVALALLTACPVVGSYTGTHTSNAFRADQVAKIERNRTTKRQIFEWFGAPLSIARKAAAANQDGVAAADDFSLFASQPISTDSTIYHYRNVRSTSSETGGGVLLPVPLEPRGGIVGTLARSASGEVEQLWILLDERTGLVQDFVVKGPRDR